MLCGLCAISVLKPDICGCSHWGERSVIENNTLKSALRAVACENPRMSTFITFHPPASSLTPQRKLKSFGKSVYSFVTLCAARAVSTVVWGVLYVPASGAPAPASAGRAGAGCAVEREVHTRKDTTFGAVATMSPPRALCALHQYRSTVARGVQRPDRARALRPATLRLPRLGRGQGQWR